MKNSCSGIKEDWCCKGKSPWKQHALKGQKLLAQGSALGTQQAAMRPVRAKALQHPSTLIPEYEFFIIFHMI